MKLESDEIHSQLFIVHQIQCIILFILVKLSGIFVKDQLDTSALCQFYEKDHMNQTLGYVNFVEKNV